MDDNSLNSLDKEYNDEFSLVSEHSFRSDLNKNFNIFKDSQKQLN